MAKTPEHMNRARLILVAALLLTIFLGMAAVPASTHKAQASETRRDPFDGQLAGEGASNPSRLSQLDSSLGAANTWIGFEKQFEETSYFIEDTEFISATLGWGVGEPHWDQSTRAYTGTAVVTMDGGETWITQTVPTQETLNGVDFVDETQGWAVGANGIILHTADGGGHWTRQNVSTEDEFRDVVFVDPSHGWAVSLHPTHYDWMGYPDNWEAAIWYTANGGSAWKEMDTPAEASILHAVKFVSAQEGWAVGVKYIGDDTFGDPQHRAVIYHTSNGGTTWVEQLYGVEELEVSLTTVDFVDALHGWVAGFPTLSSLTGGFVFHTSDGGLTWERQEPGSFSAPLWDIHFVDPNRGYAVGFNYVGAWGPPVWRTLDGGATWESVRMARHDNEGLFGVAVNGDQVIALGDHDYQAMSTRAWDSCEWTFPEPTCYDCECLFEQSYNNTHYQFQDVYFTNSENGWVVGSRSFIPELWGQVILATQDGGESWQPQFEQAPNLESLFSYFRLDGVYFVDAQNGWAVGKSESLTLGGGFHNLILHTSNGGLDWEEQGSELHSSWDIELVDVQFLDSQNGWALANRNFPDDSVSLAHTLDGGQTWSWVDTGIEGSAMIGYGIVEGGVMFTDEQHGWATGAFGAIHTENGGTSWITQTLGQYTGNMFDVVFIDNLEGWIAGESCYHTVNGGSQWVLLEHGVNTWFHALQFPDPLHGWMAGGDGKVLRSTDQGSTWRLVDNPLTSVDLNGLSFINTEKGWLAGDYGVILTTQQYPQLYLPLVAK
jgi:photosystem II stability/assembly factor-like uncharacterized protein